MHSFIRLNVPLSHEYVCTYLYFCNFTALRHQRKPSIYKGGSSQPITPKCRVNECLLVLCAHAHTELVSLNARTSPTAFISSQNNIPPRLLCADHTYPSAQYDPLSFLAKPQREIGNRPPHTVELPTLDLIRIVTLVGMKIRMVRVTATLHRHVIDYALSWHTVHKALTPTKCRHTVAPPQQNYPYTAVPIPPKRTVLYGCRSFPFSDIATPMILSRCD